MLVTAVITTCKREPEILERALVSVLNQTHKEMEVIVVDDSPTSFDLLEDVKKLMNSYESKGVKYIKQKECKGACVARNTGLAVASGEYIGFLDDDDEWLPSKIEEQIKGFTSNDIALVYCGYQVMYDETGDLEERKKPALTAKNVYKELLYDNFVGSTSFPLMRTSALKEIDGFDPLMQSAQDYDVWLRLAKKYKFSSVDKRLGLYHFHAGEQITKHPHKKIAGLERVLEKNLENIKKDRIAYWRKLIVLVPWYAKAGNRKKAFSIWFKAVFKAPFKFSDNARFFYSIFKN